MLRFLRKLLRRQPRRLYIPPGAFMAPKVESGQSEYARAIGFRRVARSRM